MEKINDTEDGIILTSYMRRKIKHYCLHSFYRMNAKTAIGYSFSLYMTKQGKIEWQGGYVFRGDLFDSEKYCYHFEKNRIFINKDY